MNRLDMPCVERGTIGGAKALVKEDLEIDSMKGV